MKNLIKRILLEEVDGIIAYHGGENVFDNFSDEFVGSKNANFQEGPGIYFTTSIKDARRYGDKIMEVRLKIKNPVSTNKRRSAPRMQIMKLVKMSPNVDDVLQNFDINPDRAFKKAVDAMIEYEDGPHLQFLQVWYDFYRHNEVDYVRNMVKLGYDSIIVDRVDGVNHIIVLDPSIIEILDFNIG